MSEPTNLGRPTRRSLLLGGAGAATIVALSRRGAGAGASSASPQAVDLTASGTQLVSNLNQGPDVHLCATDGWVNIARPGAATDAWMKDIAPFWPDALAASHNQSNLYVFGFRNATGLSAADTQLLRGQAQISAPQLAFDQVDRGAPRDQGYRVQLSNLGLSQRPDLVDGHTIHWHGFVNAIPLFDGVPELSLSVPIGRSFTYFYRPYDAGTYMYHCHYEDVEHVQMGMTGLLFVRPLQNKGYVANPAWDPKNPTAAPEFIADPTGKITPGKYVFNDGDGSTAYDREFGIFQSEIFAEGHYRDAHIQTTDWTDYKASFWCLNGRTYPDTIAPNGVWNGQRGYSPYDTAAAKPTDTTLLYQPQSALVTCNAGEKVLLRMANLGYQNHALTVDSFPLTIVGKDASQLRNANGTQYIHTNTVDVGPGESRDVIFTAPDYIGTGTNPQKYLLYDRNYSYLSNAGQPGAPGGMQTEIWVYPKGYLAAQVNPNQQSDKA